MAESVTAKSSRIPQSELSERVRNGTLGYIQKIVDGDPAYAKIVDDSGRILLHWAASSGNTELIEYLLKINNDVDAEDDMGWTPLMIAVSCGHKSAATQLQELGASQHHQNINGQSLLHYAASKNHIEIARWLLDLEVNVNVQDKYGASPIHRATSQEEQTAMDLAEPSLRRIMTEIAESRDC